MKLNISVDKRQLWQKKENSEAFRALLVENLRHRFSGELPDALGKKLESLTVEIGDYGFVDVESTTANTEIVKQVVNDVMKTTLSQPSWRNSISKGRLLPLSSIPTTHSLFA